MAPGIAPENSMPSHARGQISDAAKCRHYPHQVTIELPWNGLGIRYTNMLDWIAKRGAPHAKRQTKEGDLVMCFADQSTAADFNVEFGGTQASLLV